MASRTSLPLPAQLPCYPWLSCRNFNLLPFRAILPLRTHRNGFDTAPTNLTDNHVETTFAATLRNDSPIANCSSNGTIIHLSLQGSHLNICYYNQDPHQRYFHAGSRPDASKNYHTFQQPQQRRNGITHTPHIHVCIHSVFTSAPSYSSKL